MWALAALRSPELSETWLSFSRKCSSCCKDALSFVNFLELAFENVYTATFLHEKVIEKIVPQSESRNTTLNDF